MKTCLKEIGTIIVINYLREKTQFILTTSAALGLRKKHRELTADVKRYSQLSNTLKLINHY